MQRYVISALAFAALGVFANPSSHENIEKRHLTKRNQVTAAGDEYDFVVVGGGLAGLVVGGRLSEDSHKYSVLVLEAGTDGEQWEAQISIPGNAYYGQLWSLPLNWAFYTEPQPGLDGMSMQWPRGKVLGGSSAINGLYMTRPSEDELTAWAGMIKGIDGADNWSWSSFLAAMQKSEKFWTPSAAVAKEGDITWEAASHGNSGPIDMTWPGITFPIIGDWSQSCSAAGLAATNNAYGGQNDGAYVATSCIDPSTWTRSYSKTGYLDNVPERQNYAVLPNAFVTKVLFDTSGDDLTANGVEYQINGQVKTVKVKKEVIISGGSVQSPAILMHSGIGPKDVLDKAGVKVLHELPGVGTHMQDHLSIQTQWKSNQETAGEMHYDDGDDDPLFMSYVNDAVAFANAKVLGVEGLGSTVMKGLDSPFTDSTVTAGYEAIAKTTMTFLDGTSGQIELLLGNDLPNATCRIQVCLQHPYSQGTITIGSNDPTDAPIIDPNYLSHPADIQILVAGLKMARKIGTSGPLAGVLTESYPGDAVQTDAEWEDWLRQNAMTEFHPCGTCAMLPLEQGGVVDGNLMVYGTSNVRVADASVPPIEFSAHLMSSTYGIGEKGAEIILNYWANGGKDKSDKEDSKSMKTPKPQQQRKGTSSSSGSGSGSGSSNGASSMFIVSPVLMVLAGILAFTFA